MMHRQSDPVTGGRPRSRATAWGDALRNLLHAGVMAGFGRRSDALLLLQLLTGSLSCASCSVPE